MLKTLYMALFCILSLASASAQLRVEVSFEQETYLPKEPMNAVVRIYNSSGQTLVLGTNETWLTFSIENANGAIVEQKKVPDVVGEFTLPSAHRARKFVDLAAAYDLTKFGRYYVTATVHIPQWNQSFTSYKHAVVGISTGVKLWERAFGVPQEKGQGKPEIRKFQLVQANHLKELSLFVRITDENDSYTFDIFPLGPLMGLSRPEPQMDQWSNLHVLYQDGARSFRYTVIMPDGMILTRQSWEIEQNSRPQLVSGEDGRIKVAGGVRRVSASDLPPPELLSEKSVAENSLPEAVSQPESKPEKSKKNGKKKGN
ncbi:MAG: hypothetical protein ACTHMT_09210 [Verrucomicrobiota bacterium]